MSHRRFESQLESLRNEANLIAGYVYAELAINFRAGKSRKLLQRLNETPMFWKYVAAGFQTSAYIAISRVFDDKSRYAIKELVKAFDRDLELFQRESLAARKWSGAGEKPEWLDNYLDEAYYPTKADVQKIALRINRFKDIYEESIAGVRNNYFAHRHTTGRVDVRELFGKTKIADICRLAIFLLDLHDVLQELYVNGRAPVFPRMRTSLDLLFSSLEKRRKSGANIRAHERVAYEVDKLMSVLESIPFTVR
ncbi:MAG: transposase [Casimicrobium sp.]